MYSYKMIYFFDGDQGTQLQIMTAYANKFGYKIHSWNYAQEPLTKDFKNISVIFEGDPNPLDIDFYNEHLSLDTLMTIGIYEE